MSKQLVITTIIIIAFASCSKSWLNVKSSQSLAVPTTLNDFQSLMNNTGTFNFYRASMQEVGSNDILIPDAFIQAGSVPNAVDNYTWSHTAPYLQVSDWVNNYAAIVNCNVVLEGLQKIQPSNLLDQQTWNTIKGEALFERAFIFFEISQIFSPPYISSTATKDLGIPIRLTSDVNPPSVRSTVQATYDQITDDLIMAKDLLPSHAQFKTQPSSPAASGLLARVYLSMGDYADAKKYSDSCLLVYNKLIDYNSDPSINVTNPNTITIFNDEVLFHSEMNLSNYAFEIDSSTYKMYDSNDLRSTIFFTSDGNGGISFVGNYTGDASTFDGIATDEIYMIRAECNARANDIVGALADLNAVLIKRWKIGTFVPITAVDSSDALYKILAERFKELITRGTKWSDLRRLNMDTRFAITISRTCLGVNYTLSPNSYQYTFPIPDDIIQISHIQQNPGW